MLEDQQIEICPNPAEVDLAPIVLVKRSHKTRLVNEFTMINKHISPWPTTFPFPKKTLRVIPDAAHMIKIDLKNGYWNVPIHTDLRRFCAFSYRNVTYQYRVLAQGLSIAPGALQAITTKLVE